MAFVMNEMEIDDALDLIERRSAEHYPYVKFLHDWKEIINDNSDGWAYWKTGYNASKKLAQLVSQADLFLRHGRGDLPDIEAMHKALSPIRAAATRHGLPCPELQPAPEAGPGMRGF